MSQELQFHPIANDWPLIEGFEFADLCDSIQVNGLRVPIVIYDGMILDGRNRYRACIETGAATNFEDFHGTEEEAEALVDDLNRHRRHLTTGLLASVAARKATRKQGGDQKSEDIKLQICSSIPTRAETAKQMGVSERTVNHAAAVIKADVPEITKAMEAGTLAVSLAAAVVALPQEQQEEVQALASEPEKMREVARDLVHNHRAQGTGENEWYTPEEYVDTVREFLGGIDLDPASSEVAQKVVQAGRFFTIEDNGLEQDWAGKVWLNPPYAQPAISHFITKAVDEFNAGNVDEAVVLTHNYTDTAWFHNAATNCSAICFTRGRIGFVSPEGKKAAPTQGQAFFYFGERVEQFRDAFSKTGFVVVAA